MNELPADNPQPAVVDQAARTPLLAKIRLVLALIATSTLLPYAWGRTFLVYLMTGTLDWYYVWMMVIGVALVMLLTFRLSAQFQSPRAVRYVTLLIACVWTAVMGSVIIFNSGDTVSPYIVALGFLPATIWIVWFGWMCFAPLRLRTRVGVLALAIAAIFPFVLLFRVEGLTGAAKVNFSYRNHSAKPAENRWSDAPATTQKINLNSTGKSEFTEFLGPHRTAVLTGIKLARDWNAKRPKQLWKVNVGEGWSGFAIAGEGAVTQEQRDLLECVVCRNLKTGEEVWVHSDETHYENTLGGPGPRATPTIRDGLVYTIGATGILNCLDGGTGQVRWQTDVLKENGVDNAFHGICSSPLIIGDVVIVCAPEKEKRTLIAYDRRDGKRLWAQGHQDVSYSSPMLAEVAGVPQILYFNEAGIAAHDPTTGAVLWEYPWTNDEKTICSQPIVIPGATDQVLVTTGYGKGSVLLRAKRAADGTWEAPQPVWTSPSHEMKTKFTTAVPLGEDVYGLDDGILQCIDLKTGKQKWKRGRYGHGQLLLVDDVLLIQTEPGDVVLVEANPKKLNELGRIPAVDGKTWNCPALAGPYLVTRNDHEAVCIELPLAE